MDPDIDYEQWARDLALPPVIASCGCAPTAPCACQHTEVQAAPAATADTAAPAAQAPVVPTEPDTAPEDIARISASEATILDQGTRIAQLEALVAELYACQAESVMASADFIAVGI